MFLPGNQLNQSLPDPLLIVSQDPAIHLLLSILDFQNFLVWELVIRRYLHVVSFVAHIEKAVSNHTTKSFKQL